MRAIRTRFLLTLKNKRPTPRPNIITQDRGRKTQHLTSPISAQFPQYLGSNKLGLNREGKGRLMFKVFYYHPPIQNIKHE
jgi:hypothetical protein